MCGIAGILRLDGAPAGAAEETAVTRMLARIAHRGPDDRGTATIGPACLGAVRLSILDLSPAGHMPMEDGTGRAMLAYNGEIYDFAAHRRRLEAAGEVFRSRTDTEVLLRLLLREGEEALGNLTGMFAFALYDAQARRLLLGRDRYGVKPLYWTVDGPRLLFASEIKAILPELSRREPDRGALAEWWLFRNLDGLGERTLFAGIRQLPAGCLLEVEDGRIRPVRRWYDPLDHVSPEAFRELSALSAAAVTDRVAELLEESVRLRLVSDVPVGVLLSGGLDSSLVTLMAARHQRDLAAFHVSVPAGPAYDELPYARTVAERCGIRLVVHRLAPEVFRSGLAEVAWLEDLPITHPNSVAYHQIARRAREEGVIVLLSGEGADELFGGYRWSHRRRRLLARLRPLYARLPPRLRDALTLLVFGGEGLPLTAHRFRDALPAAVAAVDSGLRAELEARALEAFAFVDDVAARTVMAGTVVDLADFLAPLLRRLDRTTMGASVECREPFLDQRLVHLALCLPPPFKVGRRADKRILKEIAVRELPRAHVFRPKMGFPLPLSDYLRPLADGRAFEGGFVHAELGFTRTGIERILAELDSRPHGAFGLFALELWGRLHIRGESPAEAASALGLPAPGPAAPPSSLAAAS